MKALRIIVLLGMFGLVLSTSSSAEAAIHTAKHHVSLVDSSATHIQPIGWRRNQGSADQLFARMSSRYTSPHLSVAPTSGPDGSQATVTGGGFQHKHCEKPELSFRDSTGTTTFLRTTGATFSVPVAVPDQAATGLGAFIETSRHYSYYFRRCILLYPVSVGFTVTMSVAPTSGPDGSQVTVSGERFYHQGCAKPRLSFRDSAGTTTFLRTTGAAFSVPVAIPDQATTGPGAFVETFEHFIHRFPFHRCVGRPPVETGFTVTTSS